MRTANILIVEPSKDLAQVLAKGFKKNGHTALLAHTAQGGIEQADNKKPDIVILELIIPGHNGLEFIYEFRSYPEWLDVPIVIYSQIAPSELGIDSKLLNEMGIVGHFYKPTTSLSELARAVESAFAEINI